jgi:hypothetical protein
MGHLRAPGQAWRELERLGSWLQHGVRQHGGVTHPRQPCHWWCFGPGRDGEIRPAGGLGRLASGPINRLGPPPNNAAAIAICSREGKGRFNLKKAHYGRGSDPSLNNGWLHIEAGPVATPPELNPRELNP